MNRKRIYVQLKNGKSINLFYPQSAEVSYTVHMSMVEDKFQLHTYYFDGNDVSDEANYKDEKLRVFDSLNGLLDTLVQEFPGIEKQFQS